MEGRRPKASKATQADSRLPDWRELIGHDQVVQRWRDLIKAGSLPQVMLLTGRAGIGKRSLLAALAALDGCASQSACGSCESCQWLLQGAHPEVLWVETQDERLTLDDAARVQEHLSFRAEGGRRARLAVIVDADKLTRQAANRLLKTLEEPPLGGRILLSTSRIDALLPTVLSRCMRWRIDPPPSAASLAWLREQLSASDPQLAGDTQRLGAILKRAGQSPGSALNLAVSGLDLGHIHREFWAPKNITQALAAAAEAVNGTGKRAGSGLSSCLDDWEIDLNAYYRQVLCETSSIDPRLIHRRRDVLRRARAVALGGKVALNSLLTAESIALAAVKAT